jgi:hypothetical protein
MLSASGVTTQLHPCSIHPSLFIARKQLNWTHFFFLL